MFRCRACLAAFSQNADLVLHNRNVQCSLSKVPPLSKPTNIAAVSQSSSTTATHHPTTSVTSRDPTPPAFVPSLVENHEDAGGDGFNSPSISKVPDGSDESEYFIFTDVFQIPFSIISTVDFLEYFMRQCRLQHTNDALPNLIHEDECSDSFAADMGALQDNLLWTSPNYKLLSEYANSMSLSDSDTSKLIMLVSFISSRFHYFYLLLGNGIHSLHHLFCNFVDTCY